MLVEPNMEGLGYERIKRVHGSTYKDCSTVVICPMRGIEKHSEDDICKGGDHRYCRVPMVHQQALASWRNLLTPMNQKRAWMDCVGHEVGQAYNDMIGQILKDPELSKWRFVMSIEDDMILPPDAHVRLLECIEDTGADAVSGMYFTKGDGGFNAPMAYGDPKKFRDTGVLEFAPVDVSKFLENGQAVEVNGIAQGVSLYRMELFRQIPAPWFVTCSDVTPEGGVKCMTQDLAFCEKARRAGKRFYVDCRVKAAHLDITTGNAY